MTKKQSKRVLHLSLKKHWFELITSGEKLEEYREINDYWTKRLVVAGEDNLLGDGIEYADFDYIEFTLGYPKAEDTERRATFRFKGISRAGGRPEWGAEPGKVYYVIKIGERVS